VGKGPQKVRLKRGNHRIKGLKSGYFPAEERISLDGSRRKVPIFMKLVASH
jgi:hypothetical protein